MESLFKLNRTALVTGASAGIGLELARALAPKLDALILVARRLDRLEQLAKELTVRFPALAVGVEAADLADPDAVTALLERLDARGIEVDLLPVIFPGGAYRWLMRHQPFMPRRLLAAQLAQAARKLRSG